MFQSTPGSIRRPTPGGQEAGGLPPPWEGLTGMVCPTFPGVKQQSPYLCYLCCLYP
ncbi:MAG: hypothetical protein LBO64_03045 [Desulfovibrio sp.]|nr:hypothetical protein [Desulfovibrio sp.]